ncbi:hypothetical protein [Marinobacter sp. OP 3.4]|uniref:hypothetical protein n=1 Tax=Marinobacter sp. OP 3.4 TaxID=3076501 RepID=UPI002E1FD6B6
MAGSSRSALAGLLALVMLSGCATGQPDEDGRYPGDARECDNLPLYERQECRERHPPLHEPYDLTRPELS